jgi:hypothetical protein
MFDPFLLLTPILVLAVLGLVRFIGCDAVFGLDEVRRPPDDVQNLALQYGDETLILTWTAVSDVTGYRIKHRDSPTGTYTVESTVTATTTTVMLPYGVTRYYVVYAVDGNTQSSNPSNEVMATGSRALIAFVQPYGTIRDFFSGQLGVRIRIGQIPIIVVALGRVRQAMKPAPDPPVPIGRSHAMKIVLPGPTFSDPVTDVPGAQVVIAPQSGVEAGDFVYETLPAPQVLNATATYYVVSHETARADDPQADEWHDFDTIVFTRPEATVTEAVYSPDTMPGTYSPSTGGTGRAYVPVNLLYHP